MFGLIGYKFAQFLAIIVPYPIVYFIASTSFQFICLLGIKTKCIRKNVSAALNLNINDKKVKEIARKVYKNWGLNIVDFLKHSNVSKLTLIRRVNLSGTENLNEALKKGKGVVIFTAHIGNFEWGACRVAVEGYKIWGVSLVRKSKLVQDFFEKSRLSKGLKTLYNNRMLGVFKILKENNIVAIPTDWDPTGKSEHVFDFLGKKACFPTGCVQIAMKSGASLLPSFIWRSGKYTHNQIIGEPIEIIDDGKSENSVNENMKKVLKVLEKNVRDHIEEWELFHNIWQD